MEFNLSSGSAAVVLTSIAFVWGVIMKLFPRKETPQVVESFMAHIKELIENQNSLLSKMDTTILLMKDKTDGSHDKLNIIMPSVLRIHDIETKVEDLRIEVAKSE